MERPAVYNLRLPASLPAGVVRVDRATPWGNPFRIGMDPLDAARLLEAEVRRHPHGTVRIEIVFTGRLDRATAVACHRAWLRCSPERLRAARRELRGKDLACWCAPLACHADALLEAANEEER